MHFLDKLLCSLLERPWNMPKQPVLGTFGVIWAKMGLFEGFSRGFRVVFEWFYMHFLDKLLCMNDDCYFDLAWLNEDCYLDLA